MHLQSMNRVTPLGNRKVEGGAGANDESGVIDFQIATWCNAFYGGFNPLQIL